MNRYRAAPGQGPQKATSNTTCQKCLKKDIYECKAAVQERPYISRPSRTQQLLNPKLKPTLTSDSSNELLRREGIADEQLSRREHETSSIPRRSLSPDVRSLDEPRRRTASVSSYGTVTTISTSRSRSRSHSQHNRRRSPEEQSRNNYASEPPSSAPYHKRKRQTSLDSQSPHRSNGMPHSKIRRHRSSSPENRGRPNSERRGSHRSRSRSKSVDQSAVTRHRKSLDSDGVSTAHRGERSQYPPNRFEHRRSHQADSERVGATVGRRKERSLSPYSRRLALTQAMNMDR